MMRFALLYALAAPSSALACGGFFCDSVQPVDQSGETIVFGVDPDTSTVEMHVQVEYEGPSESFAWVLPVQGEPDVFLSHSALFSALPARVPTTFRTVNDWNHCADMGFGTGSGTGTATGGGSGTGTGTGGSSPADEADEGVEVLEEQVVGAYEVTTLAADDPEVLVEWLQTNGYDVPEALTGVLAPYVANDMNFIALKLRKGTGEGKLAPLGLRYSGTTPAIPIELTSLAAQPDMPLIVYLFGAARAVPLNYLHVRLNPLAIDYWNNGSNFQEAFAKAANEAGGQAFMTDQFQETSVLQNSVWQRGQFTEDELRGADDALSFVHRLPTAGFTFTDEVLSVLRRHIAVPPEMVGDDLAMFECPGCYPEAYEGQVLDSEAVVDELVEVEVEPRRQAEQLFDDHAFVTRLRSSMSPDEMTVDPRFGFNGRLSAPDDLSVMDQYYVCDRGSRLTGTTRRELSYPLVEGLTIPSETALAARGMSEFDYVQSQTGGTAALVIEQLGVDGAGTVIVDNRDAMDALSGDEMASAGCGCSNAGAGSLLGGLPLLLLGMVRRRRA
ncbi:MAG: hypothetical protein ACI8PZ_006665 [Myxococcota bacterium]|jgi:hypothetical protein